jgi:peptidyl-lysine (3S)-dioxygenase / protease
MSMCVHDWLSRRADAIATGPGGRLFFVEPFTEKITITRLLETLKTGKRVLSCSKTDQKYPVKLQSEQDSDNTSASYLQSQNGNIYSSRYFESPNDAPSEFCALRGDVPTSIPWVTEALGRMIIEPSCVTPDTEYRQSSRRR